jgi:hypothetical protein
MPRVTTLLRILGSTVDRLQLGEDLAREHYLHGMTTLLAIHRTGFADLTIRIARWLA